LLGGEAFVGIGGIVSGQWLLDGDIVGWENRDYYRGGSAEDYFSNPSAILGFSIPFGTWLGVRVRLHFWLLLTFLFSAAEGFRAPMECLVGMALLMLTLLLHDFAHRVATQWLGGRHDEFMLWPSGGLIFPAVPPGPWPMFAAYAAPIAMHAILAVGCVLAAGFSLSMLPLNPLAALSMNVPMAPLYWRSLFFIFAFDNCMLVFVNLLPYYWFDGGCILQAILSPLAGGYRAINITCWAGMILAAPMAVLSLMGGNFLGLVMWALLFSSSYSRRRQLQAEGTGELADAIAFSASQGVRTGARSRRWFQAGLDKSAAKRNLKARREQQNIDQILAKISQSGMQSLNWRERRALRKATERQRNAGR
jgi:Zn-dependent protease